MKIKKNDCTLITIIYNFCHKPLSGPANLTIRCFQMFFLEEYPCLEKNMLFDCFTSMNTKSTMLFTVSKNQFTCAITVTLFF